MNSSTSIGFGTFEIVQTKIVRAESEDEACSRGLDGVLSHSHDHQTTPFGPFELKMIGQAREYTSFLDHES